MVYIHPRITGPVAVLLTWLGEVESSVFVPSMYGQVISCVSLISLSLMVTDLMF
jgi:hypothetical protein